MSRKRLTMPLLALCLTGSCVLGATGEANAHTQRAEAKPITIGVLVYFVFALTTFRQRGDVVVDGPPIHGDSRLQATWVLGTVAVVLVLAAYGTYALAARQTGPAAAPSWRDRVAQVATADGDLGHADP